MGGATAALQGTTKAQIQSVALRLFAERGYDSTSMREIAEALSFTKAALYYHFASKEDIVRSLIDTMLSQVGELVDWAHSQTQGPGLRHEVLTRWIDIMQGQGLRMFRFINANHRVMREISTDKSGMEEHLRALYEILTPPGAGLADQLRARLSLMVVNMAGLASNGLEASEEDILAAARQISMELAPKDPTGDPA
ncbi:MAG: TetR/AcrR family transcriptional regulator [Micrococcaceae bacterium]|nr:TetR/AcrR family transcriptional regulator [Micrococcaceae bacterium]